MRGQQGTVRHCREMAWGDIEIKVTDTGSRIARNVAQRVANALGDPGEKNGVRISFNDKQDNPGVHSAGNISLNMNLIQEMLSERGVPPKPTEWLP